MRQRPVALIVLLALCAGAAADAGAQENVRAVAQITTEDRDGLYTSNRDPLRPSPLVKLPIGRITPQGWLRHVLELEAQGMTGRLAEISPWLKFNNSAWADKQGKGQSGWEELPYWLKGYGDLGYVLKDETIIRQARRWIDAVLAGQAEDGWFGPRELRTATPRPSPTCGRIWSCSTCCNPTTSTAATSVCCRL